MKDSLTVIALAIIVVLMLIFGPLLTIWALNTLFPILAIEYSISTWFATILIGMFLRGNVTVKK